MSTTEKKPPAVWLAIKPFLNGGALWTLWLCTRIGLCCLGSVYCASGHAGHSIQIALGNVGFDALISDMCGLPELHCMHLCDEQSLTDLIMLRFSACSVWAAW